MPLHATTMIQNLPTDLLAVAGVVVLLVLLVLSAFFSSSEIAMFSLAQHRIDALVEEGAEGSTTVAALKDRPHRLLITILVGNNLVNIAMSSVATVLLTLYLSQGEAVFAATFGVTAVVLLFGESAPKSYAIEHTEPWALTVARPLKLSEYALYPLVIVFDRLTRIVNRVTGGDSAVESTYVTREDIREMIQTGENEGVIDADERKMLRRVFRFADTIAKEVMTPRLDITAVSQTTPLDKAVETCTESGHSRLPVYRDDLDTIVGVVELGDLIAARNDAHPSTSVADHVRDTLYVPESKHVDELFREMRDERVQQVVVVDEFGTTEGIVTTEDIVEVVVGEILDEQESEPVEVVDDQTVRVDGSVTIEAVNDAVSVDFPEGEEFETIAGFIFNRTGRLVEPGEKLVYDGVELTVETTDDTRIERVQITEPRPTATDAGSASVSG
ncbi:DNA-binding protein [Halorubrum saccharovorum]|uniref:DNA-binding protein n=1 Tax=Halorubrum saccharovorum TaxID=2248 RepID=A0A0F8BHM4_9EURY|nr:hemolysin family protein [Halorubrum saccharovorum]KKF39698.1 DNA-binding protein [Halorubrum saccharovorum]